MLSSFRIDSRAVFAQQFCYEPAEAYLSVIHVGVARTSHPSLPNFWLLALLDVDILRPVRQCWKRRAARARTAVSPARSGTKLAAT